MGHNIGRNDTRTMFEVEDHSDTIQQLSLFQEEKVLLNGAIPDLRALRLEEAMKAFREYRSEAGYPAFFH